MKLKAHHHFAILSLVGFGISALWLWGTMVFAGNSAITVQVGPIDQCPNIPGIQAVVPDGMQVDISGNCFTPPPPPVDVCANLPGDQAIIPIGYYRDDMSGNCYVQPAPPIDVCQNLPGTQTLVPIGYINNENGDCVLPPPDFCLNIPGIQNEVPESMQADEEKNCFTPAVIVAPPTTPEPTKPDPFTPPAEPREDTGRTLTNVPDLLVPVLTPIVDAVPETIKTALRSLPPVVAQTFPYYVFAILVAGSLSMSLQSIHEITTIQALIRMRKRERTLAEEKDNFIALASHYLRTPLTLMTSGLDTMIALGEKTAEQLAELRKPITVLDEEISSILSQIESNRELQAIEAPHKDVPMPSFLKSIYFWVPVGTSIITAVLGNFFLGVVGNVEIGTANLLLQVLMFFSVAFFFYSALRNRAIKIRNRQHQEHLVEQEQTIDLARNTFIEQSTIALQRGLSEVDKRKSIVDGTHAGKFFMDGHSRFQSMLTKFILLSQLNAESAIQVETFDVHNIVESVIARYKKDLDLKKLTIVNSTSKINITERRRLFEFVIGSLLDNAIKYSHEGGTIQFNTIEKDKKITLKLSDYGIGIPEEKIPELFKPFSRADSALDFNYEGMGFSLFLDKIIMDFVGGDINAVSELDKGTTLSLSTQIHDHPDHEAIQKPRSIHPAT